MLAGMKAISDPVSVTLNDQRWCCTGYDGDEEVAMELNHAGFKNTSRPSNDRGYVILKREAGDAWYFRPVLVTADAEQLLTAAGFTAS